MKRLELILEADTIDLRRLAEIGGGDPATFYVGTRLDGVDVRGQNLEGMKLTGLDPGKVRKDEETVLPPPPPLPAQVEMLAYIAVSPGPRFVPDRDPWVRYFSSRDQKAFLLAAEDFHGAVVVLASLDEMESAFSVGRQLSMMRMDHACLAIDYSPNQPRRLIQAREAQPFRRVIEVQSALFRTGASGADLRMLLKLLRRSRHWEAILHMAPEPVGHFTRAVIRRQTEPFDAAAAIFDRAAALRLSTRDCLLFAPHKKTWAHAEEEWSLLIRPRHVAGNIDDRAIAALLPSVRSADFLEDYMSNLAEMLSRRGWGEVRTSYTQGDAELTLHLASGDIRLPVIDTASLKDVRSSRKGAAFGNAHFTDVDRIVLSPDVGAGAVVHGVLNQRVLALSGRDLLAGVGAAGTLWSLIGAQFCRMQEEAPASELALYIRLLLASAFKRDTVHHGYADMLHAIMEGHTVSLELRIVHLERTKEDVRAVLVVIDSQRPRNQQPATVVHILIDKEGVAVSDDPLLRANDQRAPDDVGLPRFI